MALESSPLQLDMFTGQLVDARSAYHKQRDREQNQLHQSLLFPVQEIFQLGVSARPWLKALPAPKLILVAEDPRTPEEIERDLLREAQRQTVMMFGEPAIEMPEKRPIALCKRRIQATIDLYGDGHLTKEEYKRRIEQNEREIAQWESRTTDSKQLALQMTMCLQVVETINRL